VVKSETEETALRRRHHVVSRGFQRFFAVDEQVLLCDKLPPPTGPQVRLAGTRDVFVRDHFNSYRQEEVWIDRLEDEWQRREGASLAAIRSWIYGTEWTETSGYLLTSREATKVLAAIHFGRSFAFREWHAEIALEVLGRALQTFPSDWNILELWRTEFDNEPAPGQIEALIQERFDPDFGSKQ
jgi:hypothetical protein